MELNPDIVDDLLAVAHRLEFTEILHCCENYIIDYLMAPSNCLYYLSLGEKYDLQSITRSAQKCLLKNFSVVCTQEKFLELSKEALKEYVKSEMLNCESELEVFWAVVRWIQHSPDRKETAVELLKSIRYGLMLPRELLNEVWKEPMAAENEDCQDLIKNAIEFHSNPNIKPVISEAWCRPRFTENYLVIVGGRYQEDDIYGGCGFEEGFGDHPPAKMLFNFPLTNKEKWSMRSIRNEMSPMSRTYDSSGASVQIGHYLFIFGGNHKYPDELRTNAVSASNTCWRFNSVDGLGTTDQLNNMALARANHIAVLLGKDRILVAGGGNDSTEELDSCEIYSISRNSWTTGARLPRRLIYMAGCAHNGSVYVSGGKSDETDLALKSLYRYDEHHQRWVCEADMYKRRMQHIMCSVRERIYVFGGAPYDRETSAVLECEYYISDTNQWTAFTARDEYIFHPEVFASYIVQDDKVYILGGTHAGRFYDRSSAYCFDTESHRAKKSDLPYGISKSIMAVMPFSQRNEVMHHDSDHTRRHYHREYSRSLSPREHWHSRSRSGSRSPSRSITRSRSRSRNRSWTPSSDGY